MNQLTVEEHFNLRPESKMGLLTLALVIAITAPKDRFKEAVEIVHFYSTGMTAKDVETAKTEAEHIVFRDEDQA